jgi:hypothetical protein
MVISLSPWINPRKAVIGMDDEKEINIKKRKKMNPPESLKYNL